MKTLLPFSPNNHNIHFEGEITKQDHLILLRFSLTDPAHKVKDSLVPGQWKNWPRADELWKTTCFEAFIAATGKENYWEVNLSPAKQKWNLYSFEEYRKPQPPRVSADFEILEIEASRETLACTLKSKIELPEDLEANLTAVIRTQEGISYYALRHAPVKPDFHYREGLKAF